MEWKKNNNISQSELQRKQQEYIKKALEMAQKSNSDQFKKAQQIKQPISENTAKAKSQIHISENSESFLKKATEIEVERKTAVDNKIKEELKKQEEHAKVEIKPTKPSYPETPKSPQPSTPKSKPHVVPSHQPKRPIPMPEPKPKPIPKSIPIPEPEYKEKKKAIEMPEKIFIDDNEAELIIEGKIQFGAIVVDEEEEVCEDTAEKDTCDDNEFDAADDEIKIWDEDACQVEPEESCEVCEDVPNFNNYIKNHNESAGQNIKFNCPKCQANRRQQNNIKSEKKDCDNDGP